MIDRSLAGHAALFALSLGCLQGTAYLLQLAAAAQLPADVYGHIRVAESVVALLSLVQTIGIPSASIPAIAAARTPTLRARVVRQSVVLVVGLSLVVGAGYTGAARLGLVRQQFDLPLLPVLFLGALVSLRLLLVSTTQAQLRFGRLALHSLIASVAAGVTFAVATILRVRADLIWLAARTVLEFGVVALLLVDEFARHRTLPPEPSRGFSGTSLVRRLAAAVPLGLSLLLRSAIDQGPILFLAAVTAQESVGTVGLILTLITIAMMPAGILQGALLPRVSMGLASGAGKGVSGRRVALYLALFSAAPVAIVVAELLVAPTWVRWFVVSVPYVLVGMLLVAFKCVTNGLGAYLLAAGRANAIFVVNLWVLVAAAGVGFVLHQGWGGNVGALGALVAIAVVEALSAALYLITCSRALRLEHVPTVGAARPAAAIPPCEG